MNSVKYMDKMLDLFKAINGREPHNGNEFVDWIDYVELNSTIVEDKNNFKLIKENWNKK